MKSSNQNTQEERILILAPTGRDALLTARFLNEAGMDAEVCETAERLYRKMIENVGLVFLTGEALTPETMAMLSDALGRQQPWSDVPLVVLTSGGGDDPADVETLSWLGVIGNVTMIERPVRLMTLMSAVKSALRARRRQYEARDFLAAEARSKAALEQSEKRLRSALAEAEAANRLKDEFLATVSHELRTPLNAMLGWTSLLRSGRLSEGNAARALETVERNARTQAQIIEDLLDVSRIITGKLNLQITPIDPVKLVRTTIESLHPAAEAKKISVRQKAQPGTGKIMGDSSRLQQIVWNLISNAIKFTPEGGKIEVSLRREGEQLAISVKDTGDGIKPDFLPFVFDRFLQADGTTTRHYGGLGLGLSIVRHLVELHGGTVHAESPGLGMGATFTVRLPAGQTAAQPLRKESAPVTEKENFAPAQSCDDLNGLHILVVDDESDSLEMIKTFLEYCGAQVSAARSMGKAMQHLAEKVPDVLISDIGMPEADGYQFIERVRALKPESGGEIPAIALTAYARAEDKVRALRSGFQTHLAKPVEMEELINTVSAIVKRA